MRVCMHEYARKRWANLPIRTQITTPPGGGPAWAYSPYLPLESESKRGAHAKNVAMHLCVCLITLI